MDIAAWLRGLGLEQYERAFRDNDIGAELLPTLSAADLRELGVTSLGDRKRLLAAIAALTEPAAGGARPPVAHPAAPEPSSPAPLPSTAHQAERRQLTVLFCDLAGSTALAARLDPEDLGEVVRRYQAACAAVIARHDGYLAEFLGDGVLAHFGHPRAHEDDAERAVRAGLALVDAVGGLTPPPGGPALRARVGIATGPVVVGDVIGADGAARGERGAVGGTPNLAARLQALAEPGTVVIGAGTRRLVGGLFELADLGAHDLRGFAAPVPAWRVLGPSRAAGRFEAREAAVGALTPLVGREAELALLLDRWGRARDGEGQVVLLGGEPGIGKSRLVRALRERLDRVAAYTSLRYQCSPYHANTALYPIVDQLARAADFRRDDSAGDRLAKLEALLAAAVEDTSAVAPLIADLLSIPTGDRYPSLNLAPQQRKNLTLRALLGQLSGLMARRPVLVVLEDAHWADPTTLELFGLVIDRARDLPVLVIITSRPTFAAPWADRAHVTALALSRLGRQEAAGIVTRVAGKALPAEVIDPIVAKADGVPLFAEELTRVVLESGLLRTRGDRYEIAGPLLSLAIPDTLQGSLLSRLDQLAPARRAAQVGAVIGREFTHGLLVAVAEMPEDRLVAAMDDLTASGLVFRQGSPPDAKYAFKHALVRDAAYETLLRGERRRLHARVVQALEQHFSEQAAAQPELMAVHCANAGLLAQAAAHRLNAGNQAMARSAVKEAVAQFSTGLETLAPLVASRERSRLELELQIGLGSALTTAKGFAAEDTGRAYARAISATISMRRLVSSPCCGV